MRNSIIILYSIIVICTIGSCSKEKCKDTNYRTEPFFQRSDKYECFTNNIPYTYIYWNKAQIDSANPHCHFFGPQIYPVDFPNNIYFAVGDTFFYNGDSITGEVYRDDCKKEITYNVKFVKGNGMLNDFPGIVAVYCIVENVTPDYKVVVNKELLNRP